MPKSITKAQARRRLMEAEAKFKKVYMGYYLTSGVRTADMDAVSKIVQRCLSRIR